jgi:hypothetical protein
VLEGVVRVGVIDDDLDAAAVRDPLEAAGDALEPGDACGDDVRGDVEGQRRGRRGQDVGEVVPADEGRLDPHHAAGVGDLGVDAVLGHGVFQCPDDGRRFETEGDGLHGQFGDELLAPRVVHVDDGDASLVVEKEELSLGLVVGLHGRMIVLVLAAEIGEDGDVVADAPDPLLLEGVGGDFHDAVGDAGVEHVPEQGLQVGGLGGRPRRRDLPTRPPVFDRADDPGHGAGRAQDLFEEVGGRCLALGPGDADDLHPVGGVPVEIGRGQGQRFARVGDLEPRRRARRGLGPGREDGRRAVRLGLGHEVHAVAGRAAQGREKESGPDGLGVVGDPGDLFVPRPASGENVDVPDDVPELHGLSPFVMPAVRTRAGSFRSGGTRR